MRHPWIDKAVAFCDLCKTALYVSRLRRIVFFRSESGIFDLSRNINYYSSFAPLIFVTVKMVRGKNNIFKVKSFAYFLQPHSMFHTI